MQPEGAEGVLVRNVDLARQRLIRRGGELELLMRKRSMSRSERQRLLRYTMCGLDAAHAELREAVLELAAFSFEEQQLPERAASTPAVRKKRALAGSGNCSANAKSPAIRPGVLHRS